MRVCFSVRPSICGTVCVCVCLSLIWADLTTIKQSQIIAEIMARITPDALWGLEEPDFSGISYFLVPELN